MIFCTEGMIKIEPHAGQFKVAPAAGGGNESGEVRLTEMI